MRKPRPDAKLFQLTPEQQALIAEWLGKESYKAVAQRVWMDFGVRVQESSLASFWDRICSARLTERLARAANQANEYAEALKEADASWDEAIVGQIKQKIFEAGAMDNLTAKELTGLLITYADLRKQDTREAALKLMREKYELELQKYKDSVAEQKRKLLATTSAAKRAGGLTPEALEQIEQAAALL